MRLKRFKERKKNNDSVKGKRRRSNVEIKDRAEGQ